MTKEERLCAERDRLKAMYDNQRELSGGAKLIFGIDEAGRGPLCGPVVAGCCVLDEETEILYLNDSKKINEKKRELIYEDIISKALAYGIGSASPQRIDEINILNATYEAMKEAYDNCRRILEERAAVLAADNAEAEKCGSKSSSKSGNTFYGGDADTAGANTDTAGAADIEKTDLAKTLQAQQKLRQYAECMKHRTELRVLVDGNKTVPGIYEPQLAVVKGDAKCPAISAASILAKVTRDRIMAEYDKLHPEYGFAKHKGYGTKEHIEAIKKYGVTDIYRRTFLRKLL